MKVFFILALNISMSGMPSGADIRGSKELPLIALVIFNTQVVCYFAMQTVGPSINLHDASSTNCPGIMSIYWCVRHLW
jgi:hypothetical protein